MKRINFEKLNFREQDVLTRAEMKKLVGSQGYGGAECTITCNCPNYSTVLTCPPETFSCSGTDDYGLMCNGIYYSCLLVCKY